MPSLVATLIALSLVAQSLAHVSLISIYGSNGVVGHGFGVNLYGKYPRRAGVPGDAGGDSGIFQTGTNNPSPSCGRTPELGPLDIPAWLEQAEGMGLPAAYANMSVVFEAFQVNRDGGGPMSCEYNEDATGATWKPMFMSLNQAGNSGIQNQVRTNETVVTNFLPGATCTGGWTGSACIVRCRTGVNRRFGGCFAVKLADSSSAAVTTSPAASMDIAADMQVFGNDTSVTGSPAAPMDSVADIEAAGNNTLDLTPEQISFIVQQVIIQMKTDGLVVAASTSAQQATSCAPATSLNATALSQISDGIQLDSDSPNATANQSLNDSADITNASVNQSWNDSANVTSANSTVDASDIADAHLYSLSNATGSANVAADIVDNQAYNLSATAVPSPPDTNSPQVAADVVDNQASNLSAPAVSSPPDTNPPQVAADTIDNQAYNISAPAVPSHPHKKKSKHSSRCRASGKNRQ